MAAPAERMPTEEKGIALQVILFKYDLMNSKFQVALEKNFFHNQPSALRRSVDFLAERLASNVIRKVRTKTSSAGSYNTLTSLVNSLPGANCAGVKGEADGHSGSSTAAGKQNYKYRQIACSSKYSAWSGPAQCRKSEKFREFVQRLGREQ